MLLEASHSVSMEVHDACGKVFFTSYCSVAIVGSKGLYQYPLTVGDVAAWIVVVVPL